MRCTCCTCGMRYAAGRACGTHVLARSLPARMTTGTALHCTALHCTELHCAVAHWRIDIWAILEHLACPDAPLHMRMRRAQRRFWMEARLVLRATLFAFSRTFYSLQPYTRSALRSTWARVARLTQLEHGMRDIDPLRRSLVALSLRQWHIRYEFLITQFMIAN